MRNHNNYCEEDDKDKYYSCKYAELIKRLIDGWLPENDIDHPTILS